VSTLSDRPAGGQEDVAAAAELPIPGYHELTVAQVVPQLARLSAAQLACVRAYEERHGNRRPVLDAIDRALS
jgi:hypothetical protein